MQVAVRIAERWRFVQPPLLPATWNAAMPLRPPRASSWPVTWTCPALPPGVLTLLRCWSPLYCSSGYWESSLECNKVTFTGNPRKRRKCMFVLKQFILLLLSLLNYLCYKHVCVCVCVYKIRVKSRMCACVYICIDDK